MSARPGSLIKIQPISGRMHEYRWLESQVDSDRWHTAIAVCGLAGIGKTALVTQLLLQSQKGARALWIDLESTSNWEETTRLQLASMRDSKANNGELVIVDGADTLSGNDLFRLHNIIFNYKIVRTLIITSRARPKSSIFRVLELNSLDAEISASFLREKLPDLTQEESIHVAKLARGNPLVLQLIGQLGSSYSKAKLLKLLDGYIYDIDSKSSNIFVAARPQLITVNNDLISKLKRNPEDIYKLAPRKFEELIAEILKDRGWEVELTKETRDGGKDIIAYRETDVGRLLCLVEAKKYRKDRPVGVSLIRNLYGTLCDANATSGMMVTTSTFTQDAQTFQERHQYKLALRDYTHLVDWINCYGRPSK